MKIISRLSIFSFLLAVLLAIAGVSHSAFADQVSGAGIQISPTIERAELDPGATYKNRIAITNTGAKPIDFSMEVAPFQVSDIDYVPVYNKANAYTQITEWVTFDSYDPHLEVGETAEIVYHVNVPLDAPGGGQYATIFASTDNTTGASSTVNATASVGMILAAKISGETRISGEIVKTEIPSILLTPPISAVGTFKNTGNVDASAKMTIKIDNVISGVTIYDGSSNPTENSVLPGTTRDINVSWSNVPRLGVFKVTLSTEYMDDAEVKSRIVVICPIWFLAIIALIILVIIARILAKKREDARMRNNSRNSTGSADKFNL